jgi:hypothetical protein
VFLNQRGAEFSFSTPSAPPLTYTFELSRNLAHNPCRINKQSRQVSGTSDVSKTQLRLTWS